MIATMALVNYAQLCQIIKYSRLQWLKGAAGKFTIELLNLQNKTLQHFFSMVMN